MDGKVTISRYSMRKGSGAIRISIEEAMSGLTIVEAEMSLAEFGECVTGMGYCHARLTRTPTEFIAKNLGMNRETKTVNLDWQKYQGDEAELEALIEPHLVDGWMLWSNGMRTQQHGKGHNVVLYRFVET